MRLSRTAFLSVCLASATSAFAADFVDPAPPTVQELSPQPASEPQANPDATFHAAPKPLPPGAVTHDWASFLGPSHNLVSTETKLLEKFPANGPDLVWEAKRGSGYAAPAILGERLVMFHRVGGEEIVECLHRESGKRFWRFAYATNYRDRYGYNDGPRCAPVISPDENVYTIGAGGVLHCIDLKTGRARWRRDLNKEFKLKQNFFGWGATPLIEGDKLIVNVGAAGGPTVVALDLKTGKMIWGVGKEWGQSYAALTPATVHGKRRVFVFAGGESAPPTGGLLCIDPTTGHVDFTAPWRSPDRRESVNGSAPLVFGKSSENVFVSECYGAGGTLLQIAPDLKSFKTLWTSENFGTHFMTAIYKDAHLYGVDGHGPQDAFLACVNAETGKEVWRKQPTWRETVNMKERGERELTLGTFRAWLMPIGGSDRMLCLGEFGHLLWVDLSPQGYKELTRARLFLASETWTPPVLSRGLLYVDQNTDDSATGAGKRLLCYDMRGDK